MNDSTFLAVSALAGWGLQAPPACCAARLPACRGHARVPTSCLYPGRRALGAAAAACSALPQKIGEKMGDVDPSILGGGAAAAPPPQQVVVNNVLDAAKWVWGPGRFGMQAACCVHAAEGVVALASGGRGRRHALAAGRIARLA